MFEQLGMSGISDEDIEMVPMLSLDEDEDAQKSDFKSPMPLLPLRNNVLFPGVVIPISVGRDKSIKAVKKAYKSDKFIGVLAQKDTQTEEPSSEDLNKIGTIARIIKMLKMDFMGACQELLWQLPCNHFKILKWHYWCRLRI